MPSLYDICPQCGRDAITYCRCPRRDRTCLNLHHWHLCPVHRTVVRGPADHGGKMSTCTCKQEGPGRAD